MTSLKNKVFSVAEITQKIKTLLEREFVYLAVQGEISNYTRQSSGHHYFTLKDANAQISAVLFARDAYCLKQAFKAGDKVVVQGELSLYAPRGSYQIIVRRLDPIGLGDLLLKFEELKKKLEAKGYFDPGRKKAIPKFPKRIGIVTSPSGAAIQDMLKVLSRRFKGCHILLNPVKVQGEGAAQEIVQAIKDFNHYQLADVLIIGRGGGSIEDLWAFNEEIVATAIFESQIPVISAVGHETDIVLSDFTADLRAPTPSAAAELVSAHQADELEKLRQLKSRFEQFIKERLSYSRSKLQSLLLHPLWSRASYLTQNASLRLDEAQNKLDQSMKNLLEKRALQLISYHRQVEQANPQRQLREASLRTQKLRADIERAIQESLKAKKLALEQVKNTFSALDPKKLLKQGYSIVFSKKDHSVIQSARDLSSGEELSIQLGQGKVSSIVKKIEEE